MSHLVPRLVAYRWHFLVCGLAIVVSFATREPDYMGIAVATLLFGLAANLPRRFAVSVLLFLLAFFTFASFLEVGVTATSWVESSNASRGVPLVALRELLNGESDATTFNRKFYVFSVDQSTSSTVSVNIEVLEGQYGNAWLASQNDIEYFHDDNGMMRATFPRTGDPYLFRLLEFNEPIGGRTFKAEVALRTLTEGSGELRSTRGLWLREHEDERRWAVEVIPVVDKEELYELTWTVPNDYLGTTLEVRLNDFDGATIEVYSFDVREKMHGEWQQVSAYIRPLGVLLTATGSNTGISNAHIDYSSDARTASVTIEDLPLQVGETFALHLAVEPGLRVRISPPLFTDLTVVPLPNFARVAGFLAHPNLLGHTIAIIGAALLVILKSYRRKVVSVMACILPLALSGSHLAIISLLIFIAVYWISDISRIGKAGLPLVGAAAFLALIGTQSSPLANIASRLQIWSHTASDQLSFEAVSTHQHNLFLELFDRHGWVGLLAGTLAILALYAALKVSHRRKEATMLLSMFLLLQIADFTIFYSTVLFPFAFALGALTKKSTYGTDLNRPGFPGDHYS